MARQTTEIRINASPHPGQAQVHNHPARFKVLAAGRRWGKTRLGVFECLDVAAKGGRAWWVAPTYKMTEVGWRPLRKLSVQIGAEVRKADRQIVLPGGGEVTVRSADNPDTLRGEGLDFAVMDECAYMAEEVWTEAIRPALSDRQGKAIFISTPAGRNWFWRVWQRGLGDDSEWQSWQLPTAANPFMMASEIEAARDALPELTYRQEFLAEFLEGEGVVFRNILACMNAPLKVTPEVHKGHRIIAGLDWGKQHDFTCTSVGCVDCKVEIARDRFNQIDYVFQRNRLKAFYEYWGVGEILAESNSIGAPNLEMLQRDGLPVMAFETTASSKPPLIENLALSLEKTEWQFQADMIWTGELEAYERKVSAITGRSQYSAPEGMHDDTVIGRALMCWQANQGLATMRQAVVYGGSGSQIRTAIRRVTA
jgi:hypothetical protein